jgi:trehalose 6-phosphate phosphatase
MMAASTANAMAQRLRGRQRIWLFLDYDGTLDDFAPTPADILPNAEVIALVTALVEDARFRVAVVSGRRLDQISQLLPVSGLLLAGTYGLEMRAADGREWTRLDFDAIRPPLQSLQRAWSALLAPHPEFFLEDKGWSLAIHGRYADEAKAETVLQEARKLAQEMIPSATFRLLGGHKFFEVAPIVANKGDAVTYILDAFPWEDAVPLYLGDDDKDMEAFPIIKARGGYTCLVGPAAATGAAQPDFSLPSPAHVRDWLWSLLLRS